MNKLIPLILFLLVLFTATSAVAQTEFKQLPPPDTEGGKPLMQALNARKSTRSFSCRPLSDETLGNLLWATFGVNRSDGRRTVPTALNTQDIDVYVLMPNGVWRYDATKHGLQQITTIDARKFLGAQKFAHTAPVTLVYATNKKTKNRYSGMHAGSAYQNAGLYCASVGLNNVVRASVDNNNLTRILKLEEGQEVLITQTIGWEK